MNISRYDDSDVHQKLQDRLNVCLFFSLDFNKTAANICKSRFFHSFVTPWDVELVLASIAGLLFVPCFSATRPPSLAPGPGVPENIFGSPVVKTVRFRGPPWAPVGNNGFQEANYSKLVEQVLPRSIN